MNIFTCTGNLGKDAELRYTSSGTAVAGFSLAVKAGYGDKQSTLWLNCSIWGKRAESGLIQHLTKGQQVVVSGELSEREWQGNDGTTRKSLELKVNEITLVGGKAGGNQPAQQGPRTDSSAFHKDAGFEDDIPF